MMSGPDFTIPVSWISRSWALRVDGVARIIIRVMIAVLRDEMLRGAGDKASERLRALSNRRGAREC